MSALGGGFPSSVSNWRLSGGGKVRVCRGGGGGALLGRGGRHWVSGSAAGGWRGEGVTGRIEAGVAEVRFVSGVWEGGRRRVGRVRR